MQLWLGLARRSLALHRYLGRAYLRALVISLRGACYLIAREIRSDWVSASGLLGLACAWTITTGCGYLAIRHKRDDQHREWMIRSYVVASAFVFFRVFVDLLQAFGIHSGSSAATPEEIKLAAWLCWAVPLLLTEPLLQWRQLRRAPTAAGPRAPDLEDADHDGRTNWPSRPSTHPAIAGNVGAGFAKRSNIAGWPFGRSAKASGDRDVSTE